MAETQDANCAAPDWWPLAAQEAWVRDSYRLFAREGQDIMIEAARVSTAGTRAVRIDSEEKLVKYLCKHPTRKESREPLPAAPKALFFVLEPVYSWSRLQISDACMLRILARSRTSSGFFKHLQAFGRKDFARDEGFGGCDVSVTRDVAGAPESIETCYLLKYVQMHDDDGPTINPWTIRQAALYQKIEVKSLESHHIFVRLSTAMQEALQHSLQHRSDQEFKFICRWERVHVLLLKTLNANWRRYINYLDEEVSKIFDKVVLSKVDPDAKEEKAFVDGSLENVKRLQYLIDQTLRVCHMLDLNSAVMKTLLKDFGDILGGNAPWIPNCSAAFTDETRSILEEDQIHYKNASSLYIRATSISQHLRDVIAMRNNEFMKMITNSTIEGNEALLGLSQKAVSEAQSMKAITIVALVYVPASFVADFLQMGYVNTEQGDGLVVSSTKGLLVYTSIAIPLVVVTMGVYFSFELVNRRSESRKKDTTTQMMKAFV